MKQKHAHTHTYSRQITQRDFNTVSFNTNVRMNNDYVESIHTYAQTIKNSQKHTVSNKVCVSLTMNSVHALCARAKKSTGLRLTMSDPNIMLHAHARARSSKKAECPKYLTS